MGARRGGVRRVLGLGFAAAVVLGAISFPTVQTAASTTTPAPLLSTYESIGAHLVAGDVGATVALPNGLDLLIRGDSPYYRYNARVQGGLQLVGWIAGSSAAEGPYTPGAVPQSFTELPTPPAAITSAKNPPQHFLRNPRDTFVPKSRRTCNKPGAHYPVAWPTGAALDPASYSSALGYDTDVLVTYLEVCVPRRFTDGLVEGWGFAEYNWANNAFDANVEVYKPQVPSLLPVAAQLGAPVIRNGQVYLFSAVCDTANGLVCTSGRVFGAEVADNVAAMGNPAQYLYLDPSAPGGLTSDPALASAQPGSLLGTGNPPATAVAVGDYSGVPGYPGPGLEMVTTTDGAGGYQLWRSSSPFGPWTTETSGTLPGCTFRNISGFTVGCHALFGHPELSTGAAMMLSYYESSTLHLEGIQVPW